MTALVQVNAATDAAAATGWTIVSPTPHGTDWAVQTSQTSTSGQVSTFLLEGPNGGWIYQDISGNWSNVSDDEVPDLQKQTSYDSNITSTGMTSISNLQRQGTNDQANVTSLNGQLSQYTTDFQTQSTNFTPWTPQATYTPSDLTQIHDQIVWILNEMGPVIAAIQALNTWRSAADSDVTNTGDVLDWISKKITGQ